MDFLLDLILQFRLLGAGNSIFPLLTSNRNPHLRLKAYDYSHHAIKLVQRDPLYLSTTNPKALPSPPLSSPSDFEPNPPVIGTITAAVWDLTSPSLPSDLEESSVDIVILVFVLSALSPDEWGRAVANIYKVVPVPFLFRNSQTFTDILSPLMSNRFSNQTGSSSYETTVVMILLNSDLRVVDY